MLPFLSYGIVVYKERCDYGGYSFLSDKQSLIKSKWKHRGGEKLFEIVANNTVNPIPYGVTHISYLENILGAF